MIHNVQWENFIDFSNKQSKLKPEESSIILYCPECCLTNCYYKCQLKTILVFVNWYQLMSS